MAIHRWSERSIANLDVHPDLRKVADKALELLNDTPYDFIVTDGGRTLAEQKRFVAEGKSQTMKSRHLGGFALDYVAIYYDPVAGRRLVTYEPKAMTVVAEAFKKAGKMLKIPIEWGGDWKGAWDMPHIQLRRKEYPG